LRLWTLRRTRSTCSRTPKAVRYTPSAISRTAGRASARRSPREGVTDAEGGCIFDIPGPGELKVVLHAGEGHGNEYTLKAEEIAEALGTGAKAPVMENATGAPAPATAQSAPSALPAPEVTSPAYMDTDEETMRRIVSEELDKKMKPVNRQLMDIKAAMENPTLSDTLSGIGYIFGLLGIILYLRSRKK